MKKEELFDVIGDIDENYVDEAHKGVRKYWKGYRYILGLVLLVVIIIGGIGISRSLKEPNQDISKENDIETETESEAKIMKDVVFLNRPAVGALRGVPRPSAWEKINYESKYPYEYNEAEDGDKLYAFYIYFFSYQKGFGEITPADFPVQRTDESDKEYQNRISLYGKNRLVEVMKSEGIWVLSECLEEETPVCLIACTMSDLVRVFDSDTSVFRDETNIFSKWDYIITSTQRPDIVEVTTQAGWSKETGRELEGWFWEHLEEVQKLIGTEYQVTMSVEVE